MLLLLLAAWAAEMKAMPRVLESLDNLALSLREETEAKRFAAYEASCTAESDRSKEQLAQLAERLEVVKAESAETGTRVEELDEAILAKKLEIETVEASVKEEEGARDATRAKYEEEEKKLRESKVELGEALAEHAESQWTEKASLSQLRKLSRSLLTTSMQERAAPSFLQLGQPHELEVAEDKLRKELDALRADFEKTRDEHGAHIDELHEDRAALELDLAKLVPAKANAEARASGSGARAMDIERTQGKVTAYAESQQALCRHVLDELQAEDERRAVVEHKLAAAIESLSSSVFSSLVEKSAKALDMEPAPPPPEPARPEPAPSFVQLTRRVRHEALQPVSFLQQSLLVRLGAEADPFLDVKNRIRALMDSLREANNQDVDSATWCARESEATERNAEKKKNEVDMNTAVIKEHLDMEAEFAEEKAEVEQQQHAVGVAVHEMQQNFASHRDKVKERRKAHLLAQEVLADGARLVREFYGVAEQAGAFLQQTPTEAGQKEAAERAITLLDEAGQGIAEMVSEAERQAAPGEALEEACAKAGDALQLAQKQELNSLEVVATALEDGRLEAEVAKQNAEAALTSLDATKEQVKLECMSPDDGVDAAKRREEQIAAMKDALKVLEGEEIPIPALLQGRPGQPAQRGQPELSLLDRAAAAMGIRVRPQ